MTEDLSTVMNRIVPHLGVLSMEYLVQGIDLKDLNEKLVDTVVTDIQYLMDCGQEKLLYTLFDSTLFYTWQMVPGNGEESFKEHEENFDFLKRVLLEMSSDDDEEDEEQETVPTSSDKETVDFLNHCLSLSLS